jgi:hypothetical protein
MEPKTDFPRKFAVALRGDYDEPQRGNLWGTLRGGGCLPWVTASLP